jgi:hypothetical protein
MDRKYQNHREFATIQTIDGPTGGSCLRNPTTKEGKAWVAQVERQGCALIFSSQWPDKVGKGLMFISLDVEVLNALRAELEGSGVDVKDGRWGYRLMVIVDPDSNELYFPYPADAKET